MTELTVIGVAGLPEFRANDDLAQAITAAVVLQDRDVVVVAQKIVSKVEGAVVETPVAEDGADPRRILARSFATDVVADAPWALIVRTTHGFVCANAGIDASNVPDGKLTLLPDDPDASARVLRERIRELAGVDVAVVVADTFGRPWRTGQVDVAIGVAGLDPIRDERGLVDREGQLLAVTEAAVADELAAAADLVRRKAEGVPVVVIRGFEYEDSETARATDLVRSPDFDLFARGRGMLGSALTGPWPEDVARPLDEDDLAAVREVAPDVVVVGAGPPTVLAVADPLAAGLAAAVLADRGAAVRWRRDAAGVLLESGRIASAR